jgi:hypothetical protein
LGPSEEELRSPVDCDAEYGLDVQLEMGERAKRLEVGNPDLVAHPAGDDEAAV